MEPLLQIRESRDEMYELISARKEAMDEQMAIDIENSDSFSIDRLQDEELVAAMNARQSRMMNRYRSRQQHYERELQELEQRRNEPDGRLQYNLKKIQAEQSKMEMHLMAASLLGREAAAKRIRAEGLARIIDCRRNILEYYRGQQNLGRRQDRSRDGQEAELAREEEVQKKAAAEFKLRVLTAAALARIQAERNQPEDAAEVMEAFMNTDFSTKVFEADYVIQNLEDCLRKAVLVMRLRGMVFAGDDAEQVQEKLDAVSDYVDVVESALWEYGITIDYGALQIRGIENEDFAQRKREYQTNGAWRFYCGARRYRHMGEEENLEQGGPEQTRVEAKYDMLERKLGIRDQVEEDMRIIRARNRHVDEQGQVNPGDEIRASWEDAQGRMEYFQLKRRFYKIYQMLRNRIMQKLQQREEEGAEAFQSLSGFVFQYVSCNRNVYGDRKETEEKEAKALAKLKDALVRVQRFGKNKCSKYAAILLGLLAGENNGYLEVMPVGEHIRVDDSELALGRRKIPGISMIRTYRDCTDMPLFTHRPNIKDIEQGGLGDCYLLAGLISVVEHDAEAIMNIMRDNGDGTVTVCFKRGENQPRGRVYTPYYVTVKKSIPVYKVVGNDTFSRGALWVKMMEKAYAASGLHVAEAQRRNRRDYDDISSGGAGDFIGLLLGQESEVHNPYKNRADTAADRIGRLLPATAEPQWDPNPARRYGNENADSIVYEFIERVFPPAADMFLHLKRPAENAPDAVRNQYEMERQLLKDYVRSCKLHLDIVDTIAREKGVDILRLDSQRKIENWYGSLASMFAHFHRNARNRNIALNKSDKIIAGVRNSYRNSHLADCFSRITPREFECTLDILKNRHLALFGRNQRRRQGVEIENDAQGQQDYYTVRDRKLYASINQALQAGSYVTFGTRKFKGRGTGLNGETEAGGLVGGHAYAIINTRRKMVGDREYLFLVVMNPWAEKGVVYDSNADGIRGRAVRGESQGEREEGVFLLDLKTFAEVVSHWDTVPA